jgi:S-(hydroxymethyl)glutathione dehydrogenase / alcohol dehydrogenase
MSDPQDPSRRRWLAAGAAAGGATLLGGATPAAAGGQAPAVTTARRFRAWVGQGTGAGRTRLQELTLRPLEPRQVLVRTEATNLCYSNATAVLGVGQPQAPPRPGGRALNDLAVIQGHGGIGVVEAVGSDVRRVQAGDRVCVSGTPQCGSCYQCLRGRADVCQFLGRNLVDDLVPVADTADGRPVYQNSHIGGLAELMVAWEEWVVPLFTSADTVSLGMVCSCVAVAGLGATTSGTLARIVPGSTVAVVGCGPLGLSAVQGARIAGASTIIAIEPIHVRRALAAQLGATHVLDPNVEGEGLVERVRSLSQWPNTRLWAGGRDSGGRRSGTGADFVVEAAGLAQAPPRLEAGPDPTGVRPMVQAYQMCATGGDIITTGLVREPVPLPGTLFAIGGMSHHGGQYGGANPMRDIPRFVALLDGGQFETAPLATTLVPLEGMIDAYEAVLYRTTITALMTP